MFNTFSIENFVSLKVVAIRLLHYYVNFEHFYVHAKVECNLISLEMSCPDDGSVASDRLHDWRNSPAHAHSNVPG